MMITMENGQFRINNQISNQKNNVDLYVFSREYASHYIAQHGCKHCNRYLKRMQSNNKYYSSEEH